MRYSSLKLMFFSLIIFMGLKHGAPVEASSDRSIHSLYGQAYQYLYGGECSKASEAFDEVDRQHPLSPWAVKGQILSAYALYKGGDKVRAAGVLDAFIVLHPGHVALAYACYLRALCAFRDIGWVENDPSRALEAAARFAYVIEKIPGTVYAKDAKFKLDAVSNSLAAHEMYIGRFYLRQQDYLAAVGYFQGVIAQYAQTICCPEAWYRLAECYLGLGIKREAERVVTDILQTRFPRSFWYAEGRALLQEVGLKLK